MQKSYNKSMSNSEKTKQLERDLLSLSYCIRQIIKLNQVLEVTQYQKKNVHAIRYDQTKTNNNYHDHDVLIDRIEKQDRIKNEISFYIKRINECSFLDSLSPIDKNMVLDRYTFKCNVYDMCDKYGYTRTGLYKHVRGILKQA